MSDDSVPPRRRVNWLVILPAAVFGLIGGLLLRGLWSGEDGAINTFEGKPAPEISGGLLPGVPGFTRGDLAQGQPVVVNFWASWCPPCRAEHPALVQLAAEGIPVYGVNKSDRDADALAFLNELGNPYTGVLTDPTGRKSLEWGIVALPETFILNGDGEVVLKFAGPIHRVMDTVIYPALEEAAAE